MFTKKIMLLFFVCFFSLQLIYSQGGVIPPYNIIKQIDETGSGPEKSSLSRNIENPINLSTGGVNFTIPLYEIDVNDYSLPISLSYRSNGFKVSEMASNIGLGWNLDAGGMIIRTIKGQRDEINYNGYTSNAGSILYEKLSDGEIPDPNADLDGFLDEFQALLYTCDGVYDSEPDIYSFNFGNYSGSFVFDHHGDIHFIPQQNFKIIPTRIGNTNNGQSNHILAFEIVTDDGVIYTFGSTENNSNYREKTLAESYAVYSDLESEFIKNGNYYEFKYLTKTIPDVNNDEHYSAWLLKKIKLTDGNEINFEYILDEVFTYVGTDEAYLAWHSGDPLITSDLGPFLSDDPYVVDRINKFRTADIPRIKRIYWSQGEISFFRASHPRQDVNDNLPTKTGYAIDKIVVGSNTQAVKEIEFQQSYFDYFGGTEYQYHPSYYKRLRLDGLRINDQKYSFNYYYSDLNDLGGLFFPSRNTAAVDLWGYFKKYSSWNETPKVVKPRIYCYPDDKDHPLYQSIYSVWPRSNYQGVEYIFGNDLGNDLDPQLSSAVVGMMKTVELPTGGFLEYEYELNDFMIDGIVRQGGGVRVSRFRKKLALSEEESETTFLYIGEDGISSGRLTEIPKYAKNNYYADVMGWDSYFNNTDKYSIRTVRRFSTITDMNAVNSAIVQYEKVTVIDDNKGLTEYYYKLPFSVEDNEVFVGNQLFIKKTDVLRTTYYQSPEYPNVPEYLLNLQHFDGAPHFTNPLSGWFNNYLDKIIKFDVNGTKVQEKFYNYYIDADFETDVYYIQSKYHGGVTVFWSVYLSFLNIQFPYARFQMFEKDIIWGVNSYRTGSLLLKDITTYDYTTDNNAVVIDVTENDFYNIPDKFGYLAKQTRSQSNGIVSRTNYIYPFNYPNGYSAVNDQMKIRNILNKPLEVFYVVGNEVVNAKFTKYGFFDNFIKPVEFYELEIDEPLTTFAPSNTTSTFQIDARYRKHTDIKFAEENSKMIEIDSRINPQVALIWGYNYDLLIAKIENATYDLVVNELTALGHTIEDLQSETNTNLRLIFNDLRARPAMKDAMITSYTHEPLVGMTSQTDPTGWVTYYIYDSFGRLQYIRNHEGFYLKEYEYHYGADKQTDKTDLR